MSKPNNNAIQILRPWCEGGVWMFDDKEIGVRREAFVGGASELITELVAVFGAKPDEDGKINLIFSPYPFPESEELAHVENDMGGVVYQWKERKAWFCPCFFNYFDVDAVPNKLYAQVK